MLEGVEIRCYHDGECILAKVGHIGFRFWPERRPVRSLRERHADAVQRAAMYETYPDHGADVVADDVTDDVTIERTPVPAVPRLDLALAAPATPELRALTSSILSRRELEVMMLAAEGLSNKQIADHLGIAAHTAKFHVSNAIDKLHAKNRTHAAVLCIRQALAEA